jgi:hypothetical protein
MTQELQKGDGPMKKKTELVKKFTLSKETLHSLKNTELVRVAGRAETEEVLTGHPCKHITCV